MEAKFSIGIEQLLELIRQLPPKHKARVKAALEGSGTSVPGKARSLEELLLAGPTLDGTELEKVNDAREAIRKWRST